MSDLQCPARVFLARHGEAAYETELLMDHGGSLTARGRAQARELGEKLRAEKIAHVYSSTISRAVQTAELAAAVLGVSVTVREGLVELALGEAYGRPAGTGMFVPELQAWVAGNVEAKTPGSESAVEIAARVRPVLDDIADQHRGESRAGGQPRRSDRRDPGGARLRAGPVLGPAELLLRRARGGRGRLASLRLGNPYARW